MKQGCWEQFMRTGSVADYLDYKMEIKENAVDKAQIDSGRKKRQDRGKRIESDRTDRDGASSDTGWRI